MLFISFSFYLLSIIQIYLLMNIKTGAKNFRSMTQNSLRTDLLSLRTHLPISLLYIREACFEDICSVISLLPCLPHFRKFFNERNLIIASSFLRDIFRIRVNFHKRDA